MKCCEYAPRIEDPVLLKMLVDILVDTKRPSLKIDFSLFGKFASPLIMIYCNGLKKLFLSKLNNSFSGAVIMLVALSFRFYI